MPKLWKSPIYELPNENSEIIKINVTNSVSAGLSAKGVIFEIIDFFKEKHVKNVLDFGAGALRHCFPLMDSNINVCAVEFDEQFKKPSCQKALSRADKNQYFTTLVYPRDFISDTNKFDAVLLCYVLNIMPLKQEREKVISYIYRKMNDSGYLLYMAQWGQTKSIDKTRTVTDGYYKGAARNTYKTFYKELNAKDTHDFFKSKKFKHIASYSQGGNEQVFLYRKEKKIWV